MASWKTMIHGCFGVEDREFAGHPSDLEYAFELLEKLRKENIGWNEFSAELESQLADMPQLDANDQVTRVMTFYRVWLLD